MAGRGLTALLSAMAVFGVVIVALGGDPSTEPACFTENKGQRSELARFCEGDAPRAVDLAAFAIVVVVVGAVLAAALRTRWLLLTATLLALVAAQAARPDVPTGPHARVDPEPAETTLPAPEPVIKKPPPPGANGLPPAQAAAGDLQMDAEGISEYVFLCMKGGERPKDCEDQEVLNVPFSPRGIYEVRVFDRHRWRVTGRTRGDVSPVQRYSRTVDTRRRRIVHTCSPSGTIICISRGRKVEKRKNPGLLVY
jgi:hypothetical protein